MFGFNCKQQWIMQLLLGIVERVERNVLHQHLKATWLEHSPVSILSTSARANAHSECEGSESAALSL